MIITDLIVPQKSRFRLGLLTDLVEVERILSGYGTVKPGFQVRGPVVVEYVFAASVLFAHSRHAGEYALTAVDILDGGFAEEEEYVLADVVGADKVRFCKQINGYF